MALSGIQIYKLLPQTNCKDCGFPTCLAFAMKLAAKQVELAACPHISEESKVQLSESAAPPVRLITLKANGNEVKAGNEVVLFRHEKTFYHRPGLLVRVHDGESADAIKTKVAAADAYAVSYVGMDLTLDGFAVESTSGDGGKFEAAIMAVRSASKRPLTLIGSDPAVIEAGLKALDGETPLICGADVKNWEAMAGLAKKYGAALVVSADSLESLADLTEKIKGAGVEDMVLHPVADTLSKSLALNTRSRRTSARWATRSSRCAATKTRPASRFGRRRPSPSMPGLSCWIISRRKRPMPCWSYARTSTPTHRSRSRCSRVSMRSTARSPKTR
jgi:acetyl-CoA decarbonylase/synthase complex subunit gamma